MSYKAQALYAGGIVTPQTLDKFKVWIPGILDSPIRASATTLPEKVRNPINLTIAGQNVYLPGKSTVSGTWSVTLMESQLMDIATQVQLLKRRILVDSDEKIVGYNLFNPMVFVTDQYTGDIPIYWKTLKGAWIQSVEPLRLNWSTPNSPTLWEIKFCYNWITRSYLDEDVLSTKAMLELIRRPQEEVLQELLNSIEQL